MYHFNLKHLKKELFDEAFSKLQSTDQKFNILEIGIGSGQNFLYFPPNSNLTILDKNEKFLPKLKQSMVKNKRQDLSVSELVINDAENMNSIASNSMDAVVHTFILCSVKNSDKVLSEIYRVLKPGGICVFMEHSIDNTVKSNFICFKIKTKTLFQNFSSKKLEHFQKVHAKNSPTIYR